MPPKKKTTRKKAAKKVQRKKTAPRESVFLDKIRHPKKRGFLLAFCGTFNITQSAQVVGIDRTLHYLWKQEDPDYVEAFQLAGILGAESLQDIAVERASEDSDTLLIFLLKGAMPEKYRERYEVKDGDKGIDQEIDGEMAVMADRKEKASAG